MPLLPTRLADGQLPNAKATLYTTPGATRTIVKGIRLVNTDVAARTVNLYFKRATSRRIIPMDLSLAAGAAYIDDTPITLEAGDLIEGDASVAAVVDYVLSGVEQT